VLLVAFALAASPQTVVNPSQADQDDRESFATFLAGVRTEALGTGISAATLDAAFDGLVPLPVVVTRDRNQPEVVQSLDSYLAQRLSRRTVATARQMATRHRPTLARVQETYGVPTSLMVAVWGLESNFGRFTGDYPTIQALATLAFDNRRPLFRTELLAALTMLERGMVDPARMKGSWAGAMGQPQFMPSSFLANAVDFNRDGRIDIWSSTDDTFGSMANYLKNAGWKAGERWGREVRIGPQALNAIDRTVPMRTTGCRARRSMTEARPLAEWSSLGVTLADSRPLPSADLHASLVRGQKRYFLVYRNYDAILDYNCSHSYAVAAGLLADSVP
jgi:membrane-bound lytic murein transglycosylase B